MDEITPEQAKKLADLVAKAGRTAAEAKRLAKKADEQAEAFASTIAEMRVKIAHLENRRGLVAIIDSLKGLSSVQLLLFLLPAIVITLACAGVIYPQLPTAINAIGHLNAPAIPAP